MNQFLFATLFTILCISSMTEARVQRATRPSTPSARRKLFKSHTLLTVRNSKSHLIVSLILFFSYISVWSQPFHRPQFFDVKQVLERTVLKEEESSSESSSTNAKTTTGDSRHSPKPNSEPQHQSSSCQHVVSRPETVEPFLDCIA